jgi:hypothetical protein
MKRALQLVAGLVALGTVITWAALGAHPGWTKTQARVETLDEVTGIRGITYTDRFQPGVDFLGAGLLLAGALGTGSLFFRQPKPNQPSIT